MPEGGFGRGTARECWRYRPADFEGATTARITRGELSQFSPGAAGHLHGRCGHSAGSDRTGATLRGELARGDGDCVRGAYAVVVMTRWRWIMCFWKCTSIRGGCARTCPKFEWRVIRWLMRCLTPKRCRRRLGGIANCFARGYCAIGRGRITRLGCTMRQCDSFSRRCGAIRGARSRTCEICGGI